MKLKQLFETKQKYDREDILELLSMYGFDVSAEKLEYERHLTKLDYYAHNWDYIKGDMKIIAKLEIELQINNPPPPEITTSDFDVVDYFYVMRSKYVFKEDTLVELTKPQLDEWFEATIQDEMNSLTPDIVKQFYAITSKYSNVVYYKYDIGSLKQIFAIRKPKQ